MLPLVKVYPKKLNRYKDLISEELFLEIKQLAKELKHLRVNLVNSTPRGGGVARVLKNLVPLMNDVGIEANWFTIPPKNNFFKITKEIHNALQGKKYNFPCSHQRIYINHIKKIANMMKDMKADIWVINDPQPAGVIAYLPNLTPSICRIHLDTTAPNKKVWDFFSNFLQMYDKIILSSEEFVKPEIKEKSVIIQPAIDILDLEDQFLDLKTAKQILENFGINTNKPLISQISRFDHWKDPIGVIKAHKIAKKKIPELQLVLAGFMLAQDDPEAEKIYKTVKKQTKKDKDIFAFADARKLGSLEQRVFINAVWTVSDIILQKSVREGFGLTVAEAMWKQKPVIAGNVGGIKIQIKDGENGFLVDNNQQAGERIIQLINNPKFAMEISARGRESVKNNFLMPRLLRDHLKLYKQILNK
ncbi:MAG: glycosyltransferase [Patescibacteria group bacterium]|nr:glycosyltransferase [Patescibacteria group bacterium]